MQVLIYVLETIFVCTTSSVKQKYSTHPLSVVILHFGIAPKFTCQMVITVWAGRKKGIENTPRTGHLNKSGKYVDTVLPIVNAARM